MNDRAVQAIDAYLLRERANQTRYLAELVKVPSDNPPGDCAAVAERAAALLEGLGFTVERHPVPAELARAHGMVAVTNLVVREHFGGGPTIALNAHGDVVPPGLGWTTDPYGAEIREGTMYGRGVAVSKSDFATYAYALLALKANAVPLRGSIEVHLTFDEETGGAVGPAWLLAERIVKPDYVISAGFAYDSPTLTVGLVTGGVNTNVVPDKVMFRLDRPVIPEEDPAQVEATLVRQIREAAAKWPCIRCDVRRILLAVPFVPMPGQQNLVAALARHPTPVMGEKVETHGVPIYTDARLYSTAGIPTVLYGAGPRTLTEANGHRADEKLVLDDLYKATRVVARALAELLAGSM